MTTDNSLKSGKVSLDQKNFRIYCTGNWTLIANRRHPPRLPKFSYSHGHWQIDGSEIQNLDSGGASWLLKLQAQIEQSGGKAEFSNFSAAHLRLLEIVATNLHKITRPPKRPTFSFLPRLGKTVCYQLYEFWIYLAFIGKLTLHALWILPFPSRWRLNAITQVIDVTGFQALPIIGLLSFLIGIVLSYQMGLQLRNYGANIFIVDLLGIGILREFAPLITAIMVAGRSGSSFTAALGMMGLNQEIDALNTQGVAPEEILILPRIIGLVIALPLLTLWSDICSTAGGIVMAQGLLGVSAHDFLARFPHVVPLKTLLIGLGKAPVFALIIASIGCFQGMRVKNSAESVGENTTRSVVLAIFFIIVADAAFSVVLNKMKL